MSATTMTPAQSRLFKPLKVGNASLSNRIVMAPLTRYRNDDEHAALPLMVRYYSDRASTPGTLIISEATGVATREEGQRNGPSFVNDHQVAAWKKVIDAVHAKGSYFFQQIWALGRAAEPDYLEERGIKYQSSSAVALPDSDVVPEAMTEEQILETIQAFVDTAKRVIAAGGDGVEVHGAHGYLIDQFLSEASNKRTDKWGGSIENRARLLLEAVKAVVAAVGAERVAIRLSPFASFQGAQKADVLGLYNYIIAELKKTAAPFAYLSLVEAVGDPAHLLAGKDVDADRTLDFILEAWDNQSPVIVAGGYRPDSAAKALEQHYGKWNVLVAFGRYFLANPDFVFRVQKGLELNKWNRSTFYIHKSNEGYNDYPFSPEFLKEQTVAA